MTPPPASPMPAPLRRTPHLLSMAAAAACGGVLVLAAWFVLHQISLPAFNTSQVTRALATAGTTAVLVVAAVLLWLWQRDEPGSRPRWRAVLTRVVGYLAPAGLVVTSLGLPLSATRLYLDGLQVDQGFRTQFLTRMVDTAHLADMNYADLPTYYPAGWFWLGGRLGNLLGLAGWEVFQPWALISIAAAACLVVPVWERLTGSLPVAVGVALVSLIVVAIMSPEEPYAAIVALGAPAATVVTNRALRGSWYATAGMVIYLGVAATFYTLFTGIIAGFVVLLALVRLLFVDRSWRPVIHLMAIGLGSLAIAALSWGPYLLRELRGPEHGEATAMHFLPQDGTVVPLPFLAASVIGLLCLIGLVTLVVLRRRPDAAALALGLVACYGWALASMVLTLLGTTLLGFRTAVLITLLLATAGVLGIAELTRVDVSRLYPAATPERARRLASTVIALLLLGGGIQYAQSIPAHNEAHIDLAYTDTDGSGERADRLTPNSAQYYGQLSQAIAAGGYAQPNDTVVLTDEMGFMALNPYLGFQAFTSHYANPLGEFDARNAQIEAWAANSWDQDPQEFAAALQSSPWRGPDALIFRGSLDTEDGEEPSLKVHIAEDIYPNEPNVRYRGLFFNPAVFADEQLWRSEQIGPFVVVTRNRA